MINLMLAYVLKKHNVFGTSGRKSMTAGLVVTNTINLPSRQGGLGLEPVEGNFVTLRLRVSVKRNPVRVVFDVSKGTQSNC